jgi:hypothetical protein
VINSNSQTQIAGRPEAVGRGVWLAAAAALIGSLAGADTVGAADYTVGTHQHAIAAAHPQPVVFNGSPALFEVEQFPSRLVTATPQSVDDALALLFGPQPEGIDTQGIRFHVASEQSSPEVAPVWFGQQPADPVVVSEVVARLLSASEQSSADIAPVWFRQQPADPVVASEIIGRTIYGPEQRTTEPPSWVKFSQPPDAVAASEIVGRTLTQPEQRTVEPPSWVKLSPFVAGVDGTDSIGPAEYTVGTHQSAYANNGYAVKFGRYPVAAVIGTDVPITKLRIAAPEQVPSGFAWVVQQTPPDPFAIGGSFEADQEVPPPTISRIWGTAVAAVPGTDKPPPKTLSAAPEQVASGYTHRSRDVFPLVAGADPTIGQTRISAPEQINSGDAFVWGLFKPSDVPPPHTLAAAPEQVESGETWRARFVYPYVFGTDTTVGRTWVAAPQQFDEASYSYTKLNRQSFPVALLRKLYRRYRGYDAAVPRSERNPRHRGR